MPCLGQRLFKNFVTGRTSLFGRTIMVSVQVAGSGVNMVSEDRGASGNRSINPKNFCANLSIHFFLAEKDGKMGFCFSFQGPEIFAQKPQNFQEKDKKK